MEGAGKEAVVIEMENVSPKKLDAFGLDAWVSTACPRIAIDDALLYEKPMLTFPELEVVLGLREWDDYEFDEITASSSLA